MSAPKRCTGYRYEITGGAPEEGTDIHHERPCPAHPDAVPCGRCADRLA
jgi:hypothetical protein